MKENSRKSPIFSIVTLLIVGATGMQGTSAQESATPPVEADDFALEEVIVTARRREESIRNVPTSITVFSAAEIEQLNIRDVTDYFHRTPNVSYTRTGSRGERSISIRGVSNIGGQVNSLAFYIDEFNIVNGPRGSNTGNSNGSLNPQLLDVERIEVLRGPQGTYFGRNATGGAVSITMKKPAPEFYAEGLAEYGRFDTWSVGGVVNAPVVEDKLFFRGNVFYEEGDGFVTNVNIPGDTSQHEYLNFRGSVRFLPADNVTIDLTAIYTEEEQGLDELIGTGLISPGNQGLGTVFGFPFGPPIDSGLGTYPENQRTVSHDIPGLSKNEFLTIIGRLEWETDYFDVTSVTGYFDSTHTFRKDLDDSIAGFLDFTNDVPAETFSTELRLSSNGEGRLDWIVGGIYAEDKLTQNFAVLGAGQIDLLIPGTSAGFPADVEQRLFNTDSYAFFGDATYHINDRLAFTFGGRYSHDEVFQSVEGISFGVEDDPLNSPDEAGSITFDDFAPRIALTFNITETVTAYGTISKGFKAGGLQFNATQGLPVADFSEETLWNYEGGIRYQRANGRLSANLSLFYMDWQDMQVRTGQTLIDPITNVITFINLTTNAADATNKGFEFDIRALLSSAIEVGGSVGYLDAEFDKFEDAFIQGQEFDLSGMPIPRAPEWTGHAYGQYTFPFLGTGNMEAFARLEYSHRAETVPTLQMLVDDRRDQLTAEAFDLVDLRFGVTNGRVTVDAYVENVFDEEYFTTTFGDLFVGPKVNPSNQTWGIRFRYQTD